MRYSRSVQIVIGFGGNLGEVEQAFQQAVEVLGGSPGLVVRQRSTLYRSSPVGPDQPDYLNAAVLVESALHPRALLELCLQLECRAGRDRSTERRWGPRRLDLDLLAADHLVCRGSDLELPHPRFAERAFALVPAADVAPGWVHPLIGRTLEDLAALAVGADPHAVQAVSRW